MSITSSAGFLNQVQASQWPDARYAIIVVRKDLLYLFSLVVLCLLLFFWKLDLLKLWDVDEGMHASMASHMVRSGNWITPVFNGEAFMDKPVLFNWLGAISFSLLGFTEFAARLPSAALGLGCVLTTFFIGRKICNSDVGVLAGIVLATSLEVIVVSRQVQYDIPFTFFTTLSLYYFCSAYLDRHRRDLHLVLMYLAISLAVLTKGPIGLLLPMLAILAFLAQQRRLHFLLDINAGHGLLLVFLVAMPWFILMELANPGYLEYFVVKQHFANVLGGVGELSARHPRPFYYYMPVLFAGFFPWSALLPGAIRNVLGKPDDLSRFLLIWGACVLLVFSVSSSKLSTYILPLFPAAAVLVGKYVRDLLAAKQLAQRRALLVSTGVLTLILLALATYTVLYDPWAFWEQERGINWFRFELFAFALFAMSATAFAAILMRKYAAGIAAVSAIAPVAAFTVLLQIAPDAEPFNSSADIGARYDRLLAPGQKMVFSTRMLDSALFYSGRDALILETGQELSDYLATDETVYVLLNQVSRTDSGAFDGNYFVLHQSGNKAIVSNRPATPDVTSRLAFSD